VSAAAILLTSRDVTALEVLLSGGYFTHKLERAWRGEKFATRLVTGDRQRLPGVGYATMVKLRDAGMLARLDCQPGSCWETRYGLAS
jgi:hypothetical protein